MSQRDLMGDRPAGTFNVLPHKVSLSHPLVIFILKTLIAITHTPSCTLSNALGPARPPKGCAGGRPSPRDGGVARLPCPPPTWRRGRATPRPRAAQRARGGTPLPVPKMAPNAVSPMPCPQSRWRLWASSRPPSRSEDGSSPPPPSAYRMAPRTGDSPRPLSRPQPIVFARGARAPTPGGGWSRPPVRVTAPPTNGAPARVRRAGRRRHFVSL